MEYMYCCDTLDENYDRCPSSTLNRPHQYSCFDWLNQNLSCAFFHLLPPDLLTMPDALSRQDHDCVAVESVFHLLGPTMFQRWRARSWWAAMTWRWRLMSLNWRW